MGLPEIQNAIGKDTSSSLTLQQLISKLSDAKTDDGDCSFPLDANLLESYSFADYDGGEVAIHVSLPNADSSCRGQFEVLTIHLPLPAALKPWLVDAAAQRQGLLERDLKKIAKEEAKTDFQFSK